MTMRALVAVTLALGIPVVQSDATRVLADMRKALGGDAALAAVQSFSASGFKSHNIDGSESSLGVEWLSRLPDSFVEVRRVSSPFGDVVEADGFRGDALIFGRDASTPLNPFQGVTPAERAAIEARFVRNRKREFSRLAIALIGPPAIDSLDVSYGGQRSIAGRPCDLLQLRASDGYTATLAVDAATHLPVSVTWMAAPPFTVKTTSTAVVRDGEPIGASQMSAPRAAVAPPAGTNPVEFEVLFEDYKAVGGLNWPHRFTQRIAGRVSETTRVGKYKLNPKIDPKRFDPARY